jgi:hypothetical protein
MDASDLRIEPCAESALRFKTAEHGAAEPDLMPQAITATERRGAGRYTSRRKSTARSCGGGRRTQGNGGMSAAVP